MSSGLTSYRHPEPSSPFVRTNTTSQHALSARSAAVRDDDGCDDKQPPSMLSSTQMTTDDLGTLSVGEVCVYCDVYHSISRHWPD